MSIDLRAMSAVPLPARTESTLLSTSSTMASKKLISLISTAMKNRFVGDALTVSLATFQHLPHSPQYDFGNGRTHAITNLSKRVPLGLVELIPIGKPLQACSFARRNNTWPQVVDRANSLEGTAVRSRP